MNGSTVPEQASGARILVVDDEPNIRSAMVHALRILGYYAAEAASGREALDLLGTLHFDAMLLDIHMPDMSGIEVMQHVRRMGHDLAIVVLTGHGTLESALSAIRAHVAEYLIKPASVLQIHETLAAALAKRTRDQQTQRLMQTIEQAVQGLQELDVRRAPAAEAGRFLHAGPLLLDQTSRTAIYAGESAFTVSLSDSEARLLAHFLSHPNQVVSCRRLAAVLGYNLEESEAETLVRPHISRLRQRLGDMPGVAEMLRTVRNRGYVLASGE